MAFDLTGKSKLKLVDDSEVILVAPPTAAVFRIVTRLRGPEGVPVMAWLNDVGLGERALAEEARDEEWLLPQEAVHTRALNVFRLRAVDGTTVFEMLDIEAGPIR